MLFGRISSSYFLFLGLMYSLGFDRFDYGKNGHLRSESLGPFCLGSVFFQKDVCV